MRVGQSVVCEGGAVWCVRVGQSVVVRRGNVMM